MKPYAQPIGKNDRISTREELGEVLDLLINLHQLPFEATREELLDSDSRPTVESDQLWPDADREAGATVPVEPLANFILGRQHNTN